MTRFTDRQDAGRRLAAELQRFAPERPIVLALPRGGVPVAYEVARTLGAPLDICVVRKVGVPWHPELGMGAVAEGGYLHLSRSIVARLGVTEGELAEVVAHERAKVEERVRRFRGGQPRPTLQGRTVLLVDDGIATGGTVRVAIQAVKAEQPRRIILAVPVAAAETVEALAREVDEVVCLLAPADLHAIGLWYDDFGQVSDEEVARLLALAREREPLDEPRPLALA